MKIPLNRVVAFAGPYITLVSAGAAAWLVAKANILGIPGLDQANTATWVAGALTFAVHAGLSHLGQMKWLDGHHIELMNNTIGDFVGTPPDATTVDDDVDTIQSPLPTDEEEFASQPDDAGGPDSHAKPV